MEQLNPNHLDPADPHNLQGSETPVLERIAIATNGNDCDECVRHLREPLMKLTGVTEVTADAKAERVWVTFDARKVQEAAIHEAIERSGYKAAPFAS
ncbi:MAG: heavy-metal-associated domain-containing protein [Verrucomicrobiota bacterium]|nr:heavy-metal-associated domain-containing protein [Verrucomicrobiota bacterium]